MVESDEDTYTVPLVDQRVFGAGISKQRVRFVPASDPAAAPSSNSEEQGRAISEFYLSLVAPKPKASTSSESIEQPGEKTVNDRPDRGETSDDPTVVVASPAKTCDICKLPIQPGALGIPHEVTLAHQVCLPHSHPPSAIDRKRKGLSYLQAYGFDPDSRKGLGASGEGILYPIKAKEKNDRYGIGLKVAKNAPVQPKKVEKLDAKQVRKMESEKKKRSEKLQQMFYQSDDIQKYLGG